MRQRAPYSPAWAHAAAAGPSGSPGLAMPAMPMAFYPPQPADAAPDVCRCGQSVPSLNFSASPPPRLPMCLAANMPVRLAHLGQCIVSEPCGLSRCRSSYVQAGSKHAQRCLICLILSLYLPHPSLLPDVWASVSQSKHFFGIAFLVGLRKGLSLRVCCASRPSVFFPHVLKPHVHIGLW